MIFSEEQTREHIKEIQRMLYEISYHNKNIPPVIPDGILSKETRDIIRSFQQEYGIPATGIVDYETWEKLVEINRLYYPDILSPRVFRSNTRLTPGSTGTAVYFTQLMLNAIGEKYRNIPAAELNGIYDAKTENSVNAFKNAAKGVDCPEGINVCLWNSIVSKFNKTMP